MICKPIDGGGGGKGVFLYEISSLENIKSLYSDLSETNYLVEEVVIRHESISRLNPSSVNTIRVYSVFYKQDVYITSATLRIGNGPGVTDNYSSVGLAAEIEVNDGVVISRAVSQSGESYYVHPYSNIPIIGTKIPEW